MPYYEDNALILRTDGSGELITVKTYKEISDAIGRDSHLHLQMMYFGNIPLSFESLDSDPTGASCSPSEVTVVNFIRETCLRGQSLPAKDPEEEHDFHRITNPLMVQVYMHEEGRIRKHPPNQWWFHSLRTRGIPPLYGDILILGQCCDELDYE
mgnify:CR=1 FL=1|tara:strand:- start:324 stop:785 length:462 start_codon:yes stop_codon:yes gene_type:complete